MDTESRPASERVLGALGGLLLFLALSLIPVDQASSVGETHPIVVMWDGDDGEPEHRLAELGP